MSHHARARGWPRRWIARLMLFALLAGSAIAPAAAAPDRGAPAAPTALQASASGRVPLMIELDTPALIAAQLAAGPARAAERLSSIRAQQRSLLGALRVAAPRTTTLYSAQRIYNGVAVVADLAEVAAISALPGVTAIHPLTPKEPTADSSMAQIRAPEVWRGASPLGPTRRSAGAGATIAVIDTGVDYIHTMFGGPGAAAYAASNTRSITDTFGGRPLFPSAAVIGGYDFVGDSYNGGNLPQPDPDPMDCHGHGTHVAGTAAGRGVRLDGTTYTGPYTGTLDFTRFRLDPGAAPEAQIYALRVFGCSGSTLVADQAIEWAIDPNGDGDLSDHVDVINLSLGSSFGGADDTTAMAAERAAELGVIVVASAGNEGDTYYITGSPATSARTISVASSVDAVETYDAFWVEAPAARAGSRPASFSVQYDWWSLAPLRATLIYSATIDGCAPIPAALDVRGRALLVDWSPPGSSSAPCGSAIRSANAEAAGAAAIIMASGIDSFHTTILGSATIPALFTIASVGQDLRGALGAGETIEISIAGSYASAGRLQIEEQIDTLSSFSSRGPRLGDSLLKPDLAAPGQTIHSAAVGSGSLGSIKSGTSMAAPHVAGMMALLRSLHPSWSVEELKALAMNSAGADLYSQPGQVGPIYGPGRVGAGRADALGAAASDVIAYSADGRGAVSLSFGVADVPPGATLTLTRSLTVANKGAASAAYLLGYRAAVDSQGVSIDIAPASITLAPGATRAVTVTLTAVAGDMRRGARDATVSEAVGGSPRHWLGEEAGWVTLTPDGPAAANLVALRVPLHAAPRLASSLAATRRSLDLAAASDTIAMSGSGFTTTASVASPTASDEVARRSAFELQIISPQIVSAPPSIAHADLQYVGVTSGGAPGAAPGERTIFFGISTYADWSTPNQGRLLIYVDTDRSGLTSSAGVVSGAEYQIFTGSSGGTNPSDAPLVFVVDLQSGGISQITRVNQYAADVGTNLLNTHVVVLPVRADQIGLGDERTTFSYLVASTSLKQSGSGIFDQAGPARYNLARPGVRFSEEPLAPVPGAAGALGYTVDAEAFALNRSLGVLLLAHHNQGAMLAEALLAPVSENRSSLPLIVGP
jgi:subtilisin family serine protease